MNQSFISPQIYQELRFLLDVSILGFMITFLYDQLRVLRRIIPHSYLFIGIEDLIFWIWTTLRIFALQYYENNGVFRWFSVLGAMIGMVIYKLLFSRIYVNYTTKLLRSALQIMAKLLAWVFHPLIAAQIRTKSMLKKILKGMGRRLRLHKFRLTCNIKSCKLALCKHRRKE